MNEAVFLSVPQIWAWTAKSLKKIWLKDKQKNTGEKCIFWYLTYIFLYTSSMGWSSWGTTMVSMEEQTNCIESNLEMVMLSSSSPRFINNIYKTMLLQSVLGDHRNILTCENATSMSVSSTENKMWCLWRHTNFRFCSIYCLNVFWVNIQLVKNVTDSSFLFFCKMLVFFFFTFLEFGHPN